MDKQIRSRLMTVRELRELITNNQFADSVATIEIHIHDRDVETPGHYDFDKNGRWLPPKDKQCYDCGRAIRHNGRCLGCNSHRKRLREGGAQ